MKVEFVPMYTSVLCYLVPGSMEGEAPQGKSLVACIYLFLIFFFTESRYSPIKSTMQSTCT